MQAHSTTTKKDYDSWEDLIAAEANGYSVVVMLRSTSLKSGKQQYYSRVIGPFDAKRKASNKAASVRRAWPRLRGDLEQIELLSVGIEPIWPDIDFRPEN